MNNALLKTNTFISNGIVCITPCKAYKLPNSDVLFIDLRMPYLCAYKKIDKSNIVYIPQQTLSEQVTSIPKGQLIILVDTSNTKSTNAYHILKEMGFSNIAVLSGGLIEWERDGLPIIADNKKQLSGSCVCQLKSRNI